MMTTVVYIERSRLSCTHSHFGAPMMSTGDKKSSLDRFFASLDPQSGTAEDIQTDIENRAVVPEGERACPICGKRMTADKKQGIDMMFATTMVFGWTKANWPP